MTDDDTGDSAEQEAAELEALGCLPAWVEGLAAVSGEKKGDLEDLRTRHRAARLAYGSAWDDADAAVAALHHDLEGASRDLTCELGSTKTALDQAWATTEGELEACVAGGETHEVPACRPDGKADDDETPASLTGRAHTYRAQAAERATLVEDLLREIDDLPTRVKDRQDEVAALVDEIGAATGAASRTRTGGDAPDLGRLYVRVLLATWRLDHVHHGFPAPDDYVALVGRALLGLHRLWVAIAELEGTAAYLTCRATSAAPGRCEVLAADPVAAVMAAVQSTTSAS